MSTYRNIQVLLSADTGNLRRGLLEGSRAVDRFSNDVKRANGSSDMLGKSLKAGLAVGATAVAVGLGYAVTKALEFDKAMRNVNSLAGLNEKQFASLEKQVVSMSTRLPQSATTLAEGLYDIASSGFQGADGLTILESSAQAASAGLSTTATSARAITSVLNAYGLQAKDAADVSDVLFQTVNLGVISFDELAGNLGDVVGGAAAAKVSIDQVGSAIATMTLAGIGGAESTTSLNQLMAKLVQPSEALAKVYKDLGYESGASALKTKGLHGVMEDLRKSTGGNITTLLELFPEIRAARGALALMANDGKNYAKVSSQIEDKNKRQGATLRTLHEQMKAVSNQWALFKNKVDAGAISLGTKMLPALSKAMNAAGELGKGIGEVVKKLEPLQDAFAAVGRAVSSLGHYLAPTLGALGQLAGMAAIGAVLALGKALETTANFMADHEQIVTLLAVAYGVKLVGAMIAARGGMSVMAWTAFGNVLVGVMNKTVSLEAAFNRLKIAEVGATLGIAAIVTAGVSAWGGYTRGTDQAKEATDKLNAALRSTDFSQLKKGADEGAAAVDAMWSKIDAKGHESFFKKMFDPGGNAEVLAMTRNIDKVEQAATAASDKVQSMRGNTIRYLTETTQLQGGAVDKWLQPLLHDTSKLDGQVTKLAARARAAGVDLAGPYDVVRAKLDAFAKSEAGTADVQQQVIAAMGQMGDKATDTADAVDQLKSSLDALMGIPMNMDEAADAFQESLDKMTAALEKNGHTLSSNTEKGRANKAAIRDSVKALREKIEADAKGGKSAKELSTTLTNGIDAIYKNGKAAGWNAKEMGKLLKQYNLTPDLVQTIVQAVGTGKSEAEVKALIKTMGGVKNKKVEVISKGQLKSKEEVKNLDKQIANLKSKLVFVKQDGSERSKAAVKALKDEIARLQGKRVAIGVDGAYLGAQQVANLRGQIAMLKGKDVHVRYVVSGKDTGGGSTANADGNVLAFANGGGYRQPIGSAQPQVAYNRGKRGIMWAEEGSGPWEAFISGHPAKRKRSLNILADVAKRLGVQVANQQGEVVDRFASGGVRHNVTTAPHKESNGQTYGYGYAYGGYAGLPRKKGEPWSVYLKRWHAYKAAAAKKAREAAAARQDKTWQRLENWRDNHRLDRAASGLDDGAVGTAWSPSQAMGAFASSQEARAQARAEVGARRSKNPYDTAADFYKAPVLTAGNIATSLSRQTSSVKKWSADLTKIARTTGSDVAKALADMGEDGKKYVDAMAKATTKDMQRMASEIRKLELAKALGDTTADAKAQAAFQANLVTLVKMGRADLASKFADMGADQAGTLAAAAVAGSASDRATLAANYKALDSSGTTPDALKLASILQGSAGRLGVVGLANASGMGLADVLGLLTSHQKDVFGPLAASGAMRQVLVDQALLSKGKQPSGLAQGGIVMGGHNRGLFYRWAEQGEGGESLIPLGQDKRQRALALWQTTGRMIGARPAGAGASVGTMVHIAEGAVKVHVTVPGSNLTAAQVEAAARRAATGALADLAGRLKAGSGARS